MEKIRRARLASAGILAVVFGSGSLVGIAVERSTAAPLPAIAEVTPQSGTGGPGQGPGGRSGQGRGRGPERPALYQQVGLSALQLARADSLVSFHRAAVDTLQREYRRTTDSILTASGQEQQFRQKVEVSLLDLRGEIRAMMQPDQLLMYDSLLAEGENRRRTEREGRPGGDLEL